MLLPSMEGKSLIVSVVLMMFAVNVVSVFAFAFCSFWGGGYPVGGWGYGYSFEVRFSSVLLRSS
jgi:hypothetical protein